MSIPTNTSDINYMRMVHYVHLNPNNDIVGYDHVYMRTESGSWFETGGDYDMAGDRVDNPELSLRLEALFWEYQYEMK